MKKPDTDIRDIYRTTNPAPEISPPHKMQEDLEAEIRRHRIFSLCAALLTFTLVTLLIYSIVRDALPPSLYVRPASEKMPYFPAHTLPRDEQWAIEYRQIAEQTDHSEPAGEKTLSTKWIKNAAYHTVMGEQALRINELEAAQDHLKTALDTFPAASGVRQYLGAAHLKRREFAQAAEQLQLALKETPSVEVLNNLGVAYIGIEKYEQAETVLKQAVQQQPELAGCYKNLALLYQQAGRTNEAVGAFEKYFALNPNDLPLIQIYVDYLTSAGRIPAALAFLEQAEGTDPATLSLLRARTAAKNADAERAVGALRNATRFLSPRRIIAEMHNPVFESISGSEPFETLLRRLELASVTLSTNFEAAGSSGN